MAVSKRLAPIARHPSRVGVSSPSLEEV